MKRIFIVCIAALFAAVCFTGCGGNKKVKYNYDRDAMYDPFWENDIVYNEIVVFVKYGDNAPTAKLLFPAKQIVSVRDHTLAIEYNPDDIFTHNEGVLTLKEDADIPYFTERQMRGYDLDEKADYGLHQFHTPDNPKICFTEGVGIVMHQLNITYTYEKGSWKGPKPAYQGNKLPITMNKLKSGEDLTIVFHGDSNVVGGSSSGLLGIEPYLDIWAKGFVKELNRKYGSEITDTNIAVGGKQSDWGAQNLGGVISENPDLVVVHFGLNDASWGMSDERYKSNIQAIIDGVRQHKADTEFIFFAPSVQNPIVTLEPGQMDSRLYVTKLNEIAKENKGVVICNMSDFSEEIFKRKTGLEIYNNNINHSSDFMVRCYTINLLEIFRERS